MFLKDAGFNNADDLIMLRGSLVPCQSLIIWTVPPGRYELAEALERCRPVKVEVFGIDLNLDTLKSFMKQLSGLLRYQFSKGVNIAEIKTLAGLTGHSEKTVRIGLAWLEAAGHIQLKSKADRLPNYILSDGCSTVTFFFEKVNNPNDPIKTEQLANQTGLLLEEANAFRNYFLRADLRDLLQHLTN